jgi:hypothetical protein
MRFALSKEQQTAEASKEAQVASFDFSAAPPACAGF